MKKKLYTRFVMVVLIAVPILLTGCNDWEKTYSFNRNKGQKAVSAIEVADSSFVIAGYTYDTSYQYPVLMKLNSDGEMIWENVYDVKGVFSRVKAISDGGFITVGTRGDSLGYAGNIMKTDGNGNPEWTGTYGYMLNDVEIIDNGYVVVGENSNNGSLFIAKLNHQGEEIWSRTERLHRTGTDVAITAEGHYIVVTESAAVIEYDQDGNGVWFNSYAAGNNDIRILNSIDTTSEGGFILGGQLEQDKDYDAWVIKLNPNREIVWEKTFTGDKVVGVGQDGLNSIVETADGGYAFCGYQAVTGANVFSGGSIYGWAMKLDQDGNEIWSKIKGTDSSKNDNLNSMIQTSDGRYLAVGSTMSFAEQATVEWWILKFNKDVN